MGKKKVRRRGDVKGETFRTITRKSVRLQSRKEKRGSSSMNEVKLGSKCIGGGRESGGKRL